MLTVVAFTIHDTYCDLDLWPSNYNPTQNFTCNSYGLILINIQSLGVVKSCTVIEFTIIIVVLWPWPLTSWCKIGQYPITRCCKIVCTLYINIHSHQIYYVTLIPWTSDFKNIIRPRTSLWSFMDRWVLDFFFQWLPTCSIHWYINGHWCKIEHNECLFIYDN